MDWKVLTILASLCILGHYGLWFASCAIFVLASFLFGFIFFFNHSPLGSCFGVRDCSVSKGLRSVTCIMECEGVSKPSVQTSKSKALDVVFNQMISYIIRDYVSSWYGSLTPDNVFTLELHRLLQQIVANTVKIVSQGNWTLFLTETLPVHLASHIRLYRAALDRAKGVPDADHRRIFFDFEVEAEKSICCENVCISRTDEQEYLRRISEMFLFFILPFEEYRVPSVRYIARELLVNAVFVPTIDLLSNPDFVNRSVAWFAKDSAFTSEYFVQSLKIAESTEELDMVIQQVDAFVSKLRGRDTGGDDDLSIKSQLKSLDYVRKVCSQRLLQIKEGLAEKPENLLAYHLQPGIHLYDMPFKDMLSSSVALVSFLEFLTSIGKHSLLRIYLNCLSYRENVEQLLNEESEASPVMPSAMLLAIADSAAMEDLSPSNSSNVETNGGFNMEPLESLLNASGYTEESDSPLVCLVNNSKSAYDDDEAKRLCDRSKPLSPMDNLRAFGVLLCGNMLKQLPTSIESSVQQVLRSLTQNPEALDANVFAQIESRLCELLSSAHYFGAFKRSPQYVQLLQELDLLKDPSEQNAQSQIEESGSVLTEQDKAPATSNPENTSPTQQTPHNAELKKVESSTSLVSPSSSVGPHAESYTAQIIRTEIMHDSYVVYTLKVTRTSMATGYTDCWQTLRRYSHFSELHALITERSVTPLKLKLPSKRAFSNMSKDFLVKRRRELNEYLTVLCSPEFLASHPSVRPSIVQFLQSDGWERERIQPSGVSSILNPLRSVSNAVKSVPDTLADGFLRVFSGLQLSTQTNSGSNETSFGRQSEFDPSLAMNTDVADLPFPNTMDDSPIGRFFLLVDEVFDLRKNHLSREGNFVILRKILQALFGPRMNKMIISKAKDFTSASKLVEFIVFIRDSIWPPSDPTQRNQHVDERDKDTKLRTRVLCRTMLLGSVAEDLAQFLGNETTRRGVSRLFRLMQEERLNRRLVHFLFQHILYRMFHTHRSHWKELIEKQLCPTKTGRPCRLHTSTA